MKTMTNKSEKQFTTAPTTIKNLTLPALNPVEGRKLT